MNLRNQTSSRNLSNFLVISLGLVAAGFLAYVIQSAGALSSRWLLALSPFGIALILAILHRVEWGLYLLVATIPTEAVLVIGGEATYTRILGLVVFGVWLLHRTVHRQSWGAMLRNPLFRLIGVLFLFAFSSSIWARYPSATLGTLEQLIRLFALSLITFDLITSWERAVNVVKSFLLGGLVASLLTIQQYLTQEGLRPSNTSSLGRAGQDISGNINDTAAILVILLPFAFYLVRSKESNLWRFLAFVYITITIGAVVVTFSRTAMMLLGLIFLFEYWGMPAKRSGRSWALLIAALAMPILFIFGPVEEAFLRLRTIPQTIANYFTPVVSSSVVDLSTLSRGFIFRVGLAIFRDHPIIGVGFNNFGYHYLAYQFIVPGADRIAGHPRSPHSMYLAFLSELGAIGFILLFAVLSYAWRQLRLANKTLSEDRFLNERSLTQAVTLSYLMLLIHGFAATIHHDKPLWLLLGLAAAIKHLSVPAK